MANRDEGEVTIRITADASDFSADLERELPRALVSAERKAEQAAKPERQRSMVNWQTVLTAGLGGQRSRQATARSKSSPAFSGLASA